jgi:hypothetical protein
VTGLLDRIDDRVADTVSDVGTGEIVGWALIGIGGLTAVLSFGYVVALHFLGDLLTIGDLW